MSKGIARRPSPLDTIKQELKEALKELYNCEVDYSETRKKMARPGTTQLTLVGTIRHEPPHVSVGRIDPPVIMRMDFLVSWSNQFDTFPTFYDLEEKMPDPVKANLIWVMVRDGIIPAVIMQDDPRLVASYLYSFFHTDTQIEDKT